MAGTVDWAETVVTAEVHLEQFEPTQAVKRLSFAVPLSGTKPWAEAAVTAAQMAMAETQGMLRLGPPWLRPVQL
jgi:hypothetical protein